MYGFNGSFLWAIIILILIVLQWFRVGCVGGVAGVPGAEPGLMANGGLFIIALFILIACSCFNHYPVVRGYCAYGRGGYGY
ncbi:hypothetical protein [Fonticella tunisiensis]|uniref:Uncharacterized protein n=1 Tax=Fonticella tunisiensis TaxID=1096341 RepID=A0A4R7KS00_9CLOT|nr:hypothetical protein [Fonticella tunisiensis]TDT58443.1 hypothetical protein EDD71_11191 [Fonticella tunisiensis]